MGSAVVDFHGFRIGVRADDDTIVAAVAARFRALESGVPAYQAAFDFEFVARKPDIGVQEDARQVYESELGAAWYDARDDVLTLGYADIGAAICRPAERSATIVVDPAAAEGLWTATRPLFTLTLAELLKRNGVYFVHAAGVARGPDAILIAGDSGSGKSTLSVALARNGFAFLGDDTVFLTNVDDLRVLAFPDEIDLSDESLALLGESADGRTRIGGRAKWQIPPEDAGCVTASSARPAVLVLPSIGAATGRLREISGSVALVALASNVLLTEPGAAQRHLDALADLTSTVSCYALEVGPDLDEAVAAIADIASR